MLHACASVADLHGSPHLPERLLGLQKLAYNLWWCWNHEAVSLFRRIDDELFEKIENSPVKLLSHVDQERLDELLRDDGFLAHMDRVLESLDKYLDAKTWFQETYAQEPRPRIVANVPHRLLLRRVRHSRKRPDLLRRSRPARRRSSEVGVATSACRWSASA